MIIRFAYLKKQVKGAQAFEVSSTTAYVASNSLEFIPLGASTLAAAPSTLVIDNASESKWYLNKPFSAVHAALTAVTSSDGSANLI